MQQDVEAARPCLEALVSKLGDETLKKVLQGMLPLALKCGQEFVRDKTLTEADKKKIFVDCVSQETGTFMDQLPPGEKDAFTEAKACVKNVLDDVL